MLLEDLPSFDVAIDDVLIGRAAGFPSSWQLGLDSLVGQHQQLLVEDVVLLEADVLRVV